MRVLMLSWEYPPVVYGGLGRHVHGLSEALAADGHEVTVLTQAHEDAAADESVHGVRIVRVRPRDDRSDFPRWVRALNRAQASAGRALLDRWQPDVLHSHDWVAAEAGIALAKAARRPLVATIHATEAGLWNGWITTVLSQARHDTETWLVRSATRTIVCSEAMRAEVSAALKASAEDLTKVHNAVDLAAWRTSSDEQARARAALGVPSGAPLVVLAGRIEWEKGGDVAVRALPSIRRARPGTHLVVAGTGSQRPALEKLARARRVFRAVRFAGHLDEADLAAVLGAADVALVPSSYEPFGMVALEAAVAGTPVVAGAAGGLPEVVANGRTGLLVPPRDPNALAAAVAAVLRDPALAARLVRDAQRDIEARFVWPVAARATEKVYAEAIADARSPRRRPRPVGLGNVFTGEPVLTEEPVLTGEPAGS
ncbi:MAG TPA: glycosyltransferase family 4 protein [Jiangellaceae bacterium]